MTPNTVSYREGGGVKGGKSHPKPKSLTQRKSIKKLKVNFFSSLQNHFMSFNGKITFCCPFLKAHGLAVKC